MEEDLAWPLPQGAARSFPRGLLGAGAAQRRGGGPPSGPAAQRAPHAAPGRPRPAPLTPRYPAQSRKPGVAGSWERGAAAGALGVFRALTKGWAISEPSRRHQRGHRAGSLGGQGEEGQEAGLEGPRSAAGRLPGGPWKGSWGGGREGAADSPQREPLRPQEAKARGEWLHGPGVVWPQGYGDACPPHPPLPVLSTAAAKTHAPHKQKLRQCLLREVFGEA